MVAFRQCTRGHTLLSYHKLLGLRHVDVKPYGYPYDSNNTTAYSDLSMYTYMHIGPAPLQDARRGVLGFTNGIPSNYWRFLDQLLTSHNHKINHNTRLKIGQYFIELS